MLSSADVKYVEQFNSRLQIVRDRTRGVAMGWHCGFYLWGEGGISKSYTVVDELTKVNVPFRVTNSRLTAKGLYDLLEEYPDLIHVLEDMESLCSAPNAAGVLRSALWSSTPNHKQQFQERLITWRVHEDVREVSFTGGIILTMNCPLDDLPQLRAVKSRIPHLRPQPTANEIRAMMRHISMQGYRHGEGVLKPRQCLEVCEHVVSKCDEAGRNYDMRMLVGGFKDRLQNEAGDSVHDWRDMIESRMRERVIMPLNRAEIKLDEMAIAHEINANRLNQREKLILWRQRTGKGKDAFYRRLSEEGQGSR